MLTAATISYKFSNSYTSNLNNNNLLKPKSKLKLKLEFLSSKSNFLGGFVSISKKAVSRRTMTDLELAKTTAFKSSSSSSNGDDEGVRLFQQEAFVDGSAGVVVNSLESTLNRLTKWIVSALFVAVILWRHDAEAMWTAMGSVVNAILSVTLKRILNHERPVSTLRSDPGMPSSHAQSIFFVVMFAILSIVELLGTNELTLILSGLALAFASYLSWLRVSQQLHTISQVVVGAAVGSIFSILWYWLWNAIVLQAFNSSLWVQIIITLGAFGFCLGFLLHVIQHWFRDER